jgi:hypothetical protein
MWGFLAQSRGVMLATNPILWTAALAFVLACAMIWIAPRPTRTGRLEPGGALIRMRIGRLHERDRVVGRRWCFDSGRDELR